MENIGRWGKEVPIFHGAVPRLALLLFKAMKMRFFNQKHAFRGASDSERREMRSTSIRGASDSERRECESVNAVFLVKIHLKMRVSP